MSRQQSMENER